MSLKVNLNVHNGVWKPGSPLINDPKYGLNTMTPEQKIEILTDFSKFLADNLQRLLIKRIKTQYHYLRWKPLSPGYAEFKRKLGLSPNIWEATGTLVNSITVYRESSYYVVGVDPYRRYPDGTNMLFVAKCMEFGTRYMPARPLFGPTINFMRRNVRKYWELFLEESVKEEFK